jgi:hypothetical protein
MIVQPRQGVLLLIRQTDHAALAGVFAAHWGRDPFVRPQLDQSLAIAAVHHDDGWRSWEEHPRVNPATHRPYQFTDLPIAEHQAFYRTGIEVVARSDLYAGLLVNLHLAGLYRRRFDTERYSPLKVRTPEEDRVLRQILEGLTEREQDFHRCLTDAGVPAELCQGPRLWANYKLLQIFDRLSLYLCVSEPKDFTLGPAPLNYLGEELDLKLRPVGRGAIAVSPYPFDRTPLHLTIPASVVPDRDYADDTDFQAAFAAAVPTELQFELRPPAAD